MGHPHSSFHHSGKHLGQDVHFEVCEGLGVGVVRKVTQEKRGRKRPRNGFLTAGTVGLVGVS